MTMSRQSSTADSAASAEGNVSGTGEIMLFGVRVVVDSMRKSVSMNNLSQYEQPGAESNADKTNKDEVAAGYASADDAVPNTGASRERKRGVPWTEEEHKLFLLGLQKVGKGDWRGISRNFVKTRTPTQVASHAQKYFLRRNNHNRRRRRSSLFDITTEMVAATPMEEEPVKCHENISQSHSLTPQLPTPDAYNVGGFPLMSAYPVTLGPAMMPVSVENPMENLKLRQLDELSNNGSIKLIHQMPVLSAHKDSMISDLNLSLKSTMDPLPLSLNLSLPSEQSQSSRHSAFQVMPSFNNEDNIISVA